jgi:hypothetical protein
MSFRLRQIGVGAAIVAVGMLGMARATTDGNLDRVANGGFETGFLSLSLPVVSHFPLVMNGWGSRGATPAIVADPELAFEGEHALRLASRPRATAHLIQDLTLTTTSYRLELAFLAESGAQEVRLLADWDRQEPRDGRSALTLLLTPDGIEITTAVGSWDLLQPLEAGQWHRLEIVADARTGTHTVSLDGRTAMSLPGLPDVPPTTIVLGESGIGAASSYLYDGIRLTQLAEAELAELRMDVMTSFAGPEFANLSERLEVAAATLARGAPVLARSELSAARRLLVTTSRDRRAEVTDLETSERLLRTLDALIELLQH